MGRGDLPVAYTPAHDSSHTPERPHWPSLPPLPLPAPTAARCMAGGRRADVRVPGRPRLPARRRRPPVRDRAAPAPANRRCSPACAGPGRRRDGGAGAHRARRRQRRRPDHPLLLRLPAAADPPRRHPPQPQRPAHAAPQVPGHRRGVDGALRPHVGHRPVAARQPRASARAVRRRAPRPVRRPAPAAARRSTRRRWPSTWSPAYGGPFFFSIAGAARGRRHGADRAHPGLPPERRGAARASSTRCARATPTRTTWRSSTSACIRSARWRRASPT